MHIQDGIKGLFWVVCVAAIFWGMSPASAQEEAGVGISNIAGVAQTEQTKAAGAEDALDPDLYVGLQESYQNHMKLKTPEVQPQQLKTILFTLWQHQLLLEAKLRFTTRPPTEGELAEGESGTGARERGEREIRLGGILYSQADSWVVWVNGQRVTPQAIPKEIMDIRVRKDYVELKWYDSFSNLIYPVRLQPHQRFNLDSRIFLPGAAL